MCTVGLMCGVCDIRFKPMQMEDSAYPFLAFSGIPSLSFRFVSQEVRHTLSGLDVYRWFSNHL